MRTLLLLILSIFSLSVHSQGIINNYDGFPSGVTFPPAGTLVTNGGFDTSTDWLKWGSTPDYQSGYCDIIANGNIAFSAANWMLYQNAVFEAGSSDNYTLSFKVRQTTGTGNFQASYDNTKVFDQSVTGSFVTYEVSFDKTDTTLRLAFGGATVNDVFEIDEISVIKN